MIARSDIAPRSRAARGALGLFASALALAACIERPAKAVAPVPQSGLNLNVVANGIDSVDLLMMVDNSNSMRDNQSNVMSQFGTMINALTNPPCRSPSNPISHACNTSDRTDVPVYSAVHDLHVGVVSSDLGTPGSVVPGCVNSMVGDDGLLNPIRNGGAVGMHEPWDPTVGAPPTFGRPTDCQDPTAFPSFITFTSGTTDTTQFAHDFQCNAGLYVNGCGLESQLEAVYRALITHGDGPGGDSMNAGFLRPDALLAILELTDEEDGSVRNCNYANGDNCTSDALDVYNSGSTSWSSANLNMRFYMYPHPGDVQDPTWPVERYFDPNNLSRGFLGLKPGHPERILFAAITGVPLDPPMVGTGTGAHVDWDQLLGPPSAMGPDDFAGRQSAQAYDNPAAPEGAVSMRPANSDPTCPADTRTVPSCRRRGSTPVPGSCTTMGQYFAWPSRRIVEIARRFDQDPVCNGAPCHNGLVTSICDTDYSAAINQVVVAIQGRIVKPCLPRPLQLVDEEYNGHPAQGVQCVIRVQQAMGSPDACDASIGRQDPVDSITGQRHATYTNDAQHARICDVDQVPLDPTSHAPVDGAISGWFYDTSPSANGACTQRITFQNGAGPEPGSTTHLECLQSFVTDDAGSTGG